ncbi:MAG TPA: hypothetical protein VGH90_07575 [Chthoniobacteraceae bacterium]
MVAVLRRISTGFLALLATAPFSAAYQQTRNVGTDPKSGIVIEVDEPFTGSPCTGFLPIHVKVANASRQGHVWTVDFIETEMRNGNWRHREKIAAGAGEEREYDLLIPQCSLFSANSGYYGCSLHFSGYGVGANPVIELSSSYRGGYSSAFILMSDTLARDAWSAVESEVKGRSPAYSDPFTVARIGSSGSRSLEGSKVKLSELPPDPRAFSSAAGLWLSESDWRGLDAPLRNAICQWLADGGNLFVACDNDPKGTLASLPSLQGSEVPIPVGFGVVRSVPFNESHALNAYSTAKHILALDSSPLPRWEEDFKGPWPLMEKIGAPGINLPAVIGFVVVFAVAVGPLNLLWFASQRRRHRLFLTTPLLSLSGCVALAVCILLGDGTGANGRRNALVLMPAGENRLSIVQEQVCRTHLLLGNAFQLGEDANLATLAPNHGDRSLERSGTTVRGDWFRSRETSTQLLQASTPTRASVVLQAPENGAPVLLSSAAATFPEIFYIDQAGKYWHGADLTPGRPQKLESSTHVAYNAWRRTETDEFSSGLQQLFTTVSNRNGYFYAVAEGLPEAPITTLPSIRWDRQTVICFGACTAPHAP